MSCFLVVSSIVLSRLKHDTTKFNKEGMTSQSKTHLSANESARTNLNVSSISYLGGYPDAFVFTVSIRVSVCQSNFWSFAMSAGWAWNILFRNTSQCHPKEERKKKNKTKKIQKILILQIFQSKIVWLTFPMFFVRNSDCYR